MLPLARDSGWKGEETTLIALASGSMDGYLDTMYMHMDARSTHNIGSQSLHIYERACLFLSLLGIVIPFARDDSHGKGVI